MLHSYTTWWPRAKGSQALAERPAISARPWRASEPKRPSPRSWSEPPGQQRVARAAQAVGAAPGRAS